MGSATDTGGAEMSPVTFEMEIDDGQTEIIVTGDRDTAVIVRSDGGEHIYLPPEDFEREPERETPYQSQPRSGQQSSYEPASGGAESPYRSGVDISSVVGMQSTSDGYVIVHPEPVTDIRFLR
ncbi:DUF7510 family protein [Natranaeroarchaeum aerophilus]|uniref:Uncharacterized protein n=1 Tax=Natranaeroarchaeum aerophilus TaxID=2917711 RepID=A0AAE3FTQ0_9EURY|nr:hypothetical protein [Natranaeroarchaeum aerophilus]MCL9815154.1 hypothetical protein [Natranaeroarchaeum aerophilus]